MPNPSHDPYQRVSLKHEFVVYDNDQKFEMPENRTCIGYTDATHPAIPKRNDSYIFRRDCLRDLVAFLQKPHGDSLYISGPTGSGKTSLVTETAARLNWPVQQITANSHMEFAHLKGQFIICSPKPGESPQTRFQYGPLARAMKFGHILLINEVDLMDPGELAGLNDVLEGRPLIITENGGEIIHAHPMFRCIVTGNSFGSGDSTGQYQGIQTQNLAALDRYRLLEVPYSSPTVEKAILTKVAPTLTETIINQMIQLANDVRKSFMGQNDEGITLAVTLSTRTLVRWAYLIQDFRGEATQLSSALNRALLFRAELSDRKAINQIGVTVFGPQWGTKA